MTGGADFIHTVCKLIAHLHFAPGRMIAYLCPPGRRFFLILCCIGHRMGRGGLLLLLGLGEGGIGFVHNFPMQPVAEVGHIVIQTHKLRLCNGECRPFDCRIALNYRIFPVRIFAGVLIGHIFQHQIPDDRFIAVIGLPDGRRGAGILPRQPFRIGHDLFHKFGRAVLFQMLPDGGGINILKVVQFFLGEKSVLLHQTSKAALYFCPGQIGGRALYRNRKRRETIAVFIFQPLRRVPVPGMAGHVLLDPALAGNITVPLLEGGVYVGLGDFSRWYCGRNRRCGPRYMSGTFHFRG